MVIIPLILLCLAVIFYDKKSINKISFEFDDEESEEKIRNDIFKDKFPTLNRLFLIGGISRWFYKQGLLHSALLIVILFWSGFLIFHNLGANDFFHDEQFHVNVIESLRHGEGFKSWDFVNSEASVPYKRGYITSYMGYLSSELFGYSEFSLRLFVAIVGLLNVLLIYIVFKKFIGKSPALLTTMGFSFSIISIFLARFLRPYTVFLFSYLIAFYLVYKIADILINKYTFKRALFYFLLFTTSISIMFQASQIGKIVLILVPLFIFVEFVLYYKKIVSFIRSKSRQSILFSIFVFLLLVFVFLYSINFPLVMKQIRDFILYNNLDGKNQIYFYYLFEKYVKSPNIMYISFFLGCIICFYNGLIKKNIKYLLLLIYTVIPLIFMVYILDRYEDFRYIYYLIPFVNAIAMLALYYFMKALFVLFRLPSSKSFILSVSVAFTLVFIFYPVLPISSNNSFALKSPSVWSGADGKSNLHRRAVVPEYKKTYTHLDSIQKPGDIVIVAEGQFYLKPLEGVDYYKISMRNNSRLLNDINNHPIDFFNLTNEIKDKTLYFLGLHMHLGNREMADYLLNECTNLSESLGVLKYNYNDYYQDRFYWPNLFKCEF